MKFSNLYSYLTHSLRARILFFFQCVVIVGGLFALALGISLYDKTFMQQAQDKVKIDLNSAWMVYNEAIKDVATIVQMTSERFFLKRDWLQVILKEWKRNYKRYESIKTWISLPLPMPREGLYSGLATHRVKEMTSQTMR